MARSVDAILKEQMGHLLLQLAILQSQFEEAQEKLKAMEAGIEANKQAQAPMKVIK